jgi:hypothetical protein
MKAWPAPGDHMHFLGRNGYDYDLKTAKEVFEIGKTYVVKNIDIGDWRHTIAFEGVDGRWNGVMFEQVEAPEEVEWFDISTATPGVLAIYQTIDDDEVRGIAEPYWCGSDCPCGGFDEEESDDILFTEPPECWWIKETQTDVIGWRPL